MKANQISKSLFSADYAIITQNTTGNDIHLLLRVSIQAMLFLKLYLLIFNTVELVTVNSHIIF